MGLIVLDSSVVIALLDPKDIHHKKCASAHKKLAVEQKTSFFIPTIALAESLVGAIRISYEFALLFFARISDEIGSLVAFNTKIAWLTASIRSTSAIGFADAAIIATASEMKAELWTCDKKLINKYKKIKYLG